MLIDQDHQIEVDMNDLHLTLMCISMIVLIMNQVPDVIAFLSSVYPLYWPVLLLQCLYNLFKYVNSKKRKFMLIILLNIVI